MTKNSSIGIIDSHYDGISSTSNTAKRFLSPIVPGDKIADFLRFFIVRNTDSLNLLAFILLFLLLGIWYFPLSLFTIVVLYGCFVCHAYIVWQNDFKVENRVPRDNATSPSNKDVPALKGQFWTDIRDFIQPSKWEEKRREERKKRNPLNPFSENRANKLDMDHVYLPFLDFLWGKTFISPCTSTLAIGAALGILIKDYAIKRGIYR